MIVRRFGLAAAALVALACKAAPPEEQGVPIPLGGQDGTIAVASAKADVPPSGPQPAIAADEAVWEFGTVLQGEDVRHTFVVRNRGDAVLKIESARGS
jgi:hypothetical protein